ncbi:hypothetical protein [Priestia aryabhattai]|uniref:hypothetical protein n=1 Tax=Priestia aryabhattai TaxID=412384 RepID=UPI00310164D7
MQNWLQEQAWWIALVLTVLIGLYPQKFTTLGSNLTSFITNRWLHLSVFTIIILLLIVIKRL